MGSRRALLIGIEEYGDGFDPLSCVERDLAAMEQALKHCGYEVALLQGEDAEPEILGKRIGAFCEKCGEDDTHFLYFSGHGVSIEGLDYLVPRGVSYEEARNASSLIPTDLSRFVTKGLVIFAIDACRDEVVRKGASFGSKLEAGAHFVLLLGCAPGQRCQVLPGAEISLFTSALSKTLLAGQSPSLRAVLHATLEACRALATGTLEVQTPRLSSNGSAAAALAEIPVFDPPFDPKLWDAFELDQLHCLVVSCESDQPLAARPLHALMKQCLRGKLGLSVWEAFRDYADGRLLVGERRRCIPEEARPPRLADCPVEIAFDRERFDRVVRCLVEADLVVFDVTDFQPGVLLLMGIRASARRGVSICTHGAGWRELDQIDVPFNLRNLSITSHTASEGGAGRNQVSERLVRRIRSAFEELRHQPNYQDLPAYEDLRRLGPLYEASCTIPTSKRVLFLCPYSKSFRPAWEFVQNEIEGHLKKTADGSQVTRLVDDGNPQLVSRSLYELVRRCAGCIVDWTEYSPSTFFELGVRLAVSEYGAAQCVDRRYLPDREVKERKERWTLLPRQIMAMRSLFKPYVYEFDRDNDPSLREVARVVAERTPGLDPRTQEYDRVHRAVSRALATVDSAIPAVHHLLKDAADALHHPDQGRRGAPQVLFRTERAIKGGSEQAARETRIAAWLYLHYRVKAGGQTQGTELHTLYVELGRAAADSLFDVDDPAFAEFILAHLDGSNRE